MRSVKFGATLAAMLLPAIFSSTAVADQWLIAGSTGTLWDYTQGSGAAINPRTITPGFGSALVTGIAFSANGTLFAETTFSDNSLYTINPTTGASTLVGNTGLPLNIEGDIGFDPTTGVLYGTYTGGSDDLYTLNTTTGAATIIGSLAGDDPSGLAFDNSGRLWVIDSNTNSTHIPTLLQVDKTNGNVLSTQSTGVDMGAGHELLGADFNPTTNQLYFAMDNGNFYREDTSTGLATLVDTHGVLNASGLAFVPEPGSIVSLILGAPALAWLYRKRMRAK